MYSASAVFLLPFPSVQGKAIGVGIGCILGMFPLFFFKDDDEKKKEGQTEAKENTQPPPAPTESSKNWETNTIWNQLEYLQLGLLSNPLQSNLRVLYFARPSQTTEGILKRILDIIWL